jgi:hypothetical protein
MEMGNYFEGCTRMLGNSGISSLSSRLIILISLKCLLVLGGTFHICIHSSLFSKLTKFPFEVSNLIVILRLEWQWIY